MQKQSTTSKDVKAKVEHKMFFYTPAKKEKRKLTEKQRRTSGSIVDEIEVVVKSPRVSVAGLVVGNELFIGLTTCSESENFNKKIGRGLATQRAMAEDNTYIFEIQNRNEVSKEFVEIAKNLAEAAIEAYYYKRTQYLSGRFAELRIKEHPVPVA